MNFIERAATLHLRIAQDVYPYGAVLHCCSCTREITLTKSECAAALSRGWPTCCGKTMQSKAKEEHDATLKP